MLDKIMKCKNPALALAVLGSVAIAVFTSRSQVNFRPMLRFDSESIECGTVAQGESIRRVFRFRNIGNDMLRIYDVTPG